MNTDQLPFGFNLPMLSDEVAAEIHNFLQIAIQIFEARYGDEIDRHYQSLCEDYVAACSPHGYSDDPPF